MELLELGVTRGCQLPDHHVLEVGKRIALHSGRLWRIDQSLRTLLPLISKDNNMTTFTRIADGETPSISVGVNRRLSKIGMESNTISKTSADSSRSKHLWRLHGVCRFHMFLLKLTLAGSVSVPCHFRGCLLKQCQHQAMEILVGIEKA